MARLAFFGPTESRQWNSFLRTADEWIINYSLPFPQLVSVQLFSIGHAFELYLKAANSRLSGSIAAAMKFSHRIDDMWNDCKTRDPDFLPGFELRPSVLKCSDLLGENGDRGELSADDLRHFVKYQPIYIIAKHLADLKYLGAR